MRNFFLNKNIDPVFQLFNFEHLTCLVITLVAFILILVLKKRIKILNDKTKKKIRIFIIGVLVLNFVLYRIFYFYYGEFNWRYHLPLAYCYIVGFIYIFALIVDKPKIYRIIYPMVYIGPLAAILFPMLLRGANNYTFYHAFFSHNFLFCANLLIFYMHRLKLKFFDLSLAFILTNHIFWSTYLFNYLFETTYNTPESLFYVFKEYFCLPNWHPYIILEMIAFIGIIISIIPTLNLKK